VENPFQPILQELSAIKELLLLKQEQQKLQPSNDTDPNAGYLSRKKAAVFLDVSLPTIDGWIKHGKIRAYRLHGSVRIKISEIPTFFEEIVVK
jgi:excisionase family DNA binding protein